MVGAIVVDKVNQPQLLAALASSETWVLEYSDEQAALLVRRARAPESFGLRLN